MPPQMFPPREGLGAHRAGEGFRFGAFRGVEIVRPLAMAHQVFLADEALIADVALERTHHVDTCGGEWREIRSLK